MDDIKKIKIDNITDTGTVSIETTTYINYNGQEIAVGLPHREALTPLDKDRAKEILPEELFNVVKALWTDKVITSYKLQIEQTTY